MKTRRIFAAFTILALMASIISGCSSGSSQSQVTSNGSVQASSSAGAKKIAYLAPGLDLPYWRYVANGIENKVKDSKMNATVQIYDSKNDTATQLKNAQDAIAKQNDIIIISPTDSASCPAVLTAAKDANIPVIIADVGTDSGEYASLVMTPNEDGAKKVGDYLAKYLKEKGITNKPVAQISLNLARNNGVNRTKGFKEAMDSINVKIADIKQMQKYTRAEAESFTQDLMTAHPDLSAVFCQTDEPTLGVVQAVQHAGKGSQIQVVGFDATPETIEAIKNGTMLAAAVQRPALFGATAVELAQKIFNGQAVSKQTDIPVLLVTKENVNEKAINDQLQTEVFPEVEK